MKTGFICASGFNLVATATRNGKRLIAVVLGALSSSVRAIKAAHLLELGFTSNPLSWLTPPLGNVEALEPINASPPDLREEMCGKHRRRPAAEDEDDAAAVASLGANSPFAVFLSSLRAPNSKQSLLQDAQLGEPVVVFTGPSPKKPGVSKTAAIDRQSNPASKAAGTTTAKPASKPATKQPTGASAVPWTSMSPAPLADSPPSELTATPMNAAEKPTGPRARAKAAQPAPLSKTPAQTPQKSTVKAAPGKSKSVPEKSSKPSHATSQKTSEKTDKN